MEKTPEVVIYYTVNGRKPSTGVSFAENSIALVDGTCFIG